MKKIGLSILILGIIILFFFVSPFLCEIIVATQIFLKGTEKKSDFEEKFISALVLAGILSILCFYICQKIPHWTVQTMLFYLLVFAISLIIPFSCYKESHIVLIGCGISGYLLQHVASQVAQALWTESFIEKIGVGTHIIIVFMLSRVVIYGMIYYLFYHFLMRNHVHSSFSEEVTKELYGISVVALIIINILSSIRDAYAEESFVLMMVTRCFSILSCVFILYLRWGIMERAALKQEQEELLRIHALQKNQYEQNKENIELINLKCHDLKHQISRWGNMESGPSLNEIQELKDMIEIYDSVIETGNEILDTILTERSLYCKQHGIRLTCMVDGSKLNFMSASDICALFGNALENAIEAVSKLDEKEDRIISFKIRQNKGMLVITIDNYYKEEITVEGGLPSTTKEEKEFHGYGLKSIRMITEKYDGQMSIVIDEMFHLTILLPLSEQ